MARAIGGTSRSMLSTGASLSLAPRPGNAAHHTSTSPGSSPGQSRKTLAPPPAYGKQNRRKRALGLARGDTHHGLRLGRAALCSPLVRIRPPGFVELGLIAKRRQHVARPVLRELIR